MASDQEPRYRLVDSDDNIVGSLYGKADGSVAIQETDSGSDREVTLAPDGTFSAPSVETESLSTESLVSDYHYAGAYSGSNADERLDSALSAATDGDLIYLENKEYSDNRSISQQVRISGPIGGVFGDGARLNEATWTLAGQGMTITDIAIRGESEIILDGGERQVVKNIISRDAGSEIIVKQDRNLITNLNFRFSVVLEDGTSGNTVGVRNSEIAVTDNGDNDVMPL